MKLIFKTLLFTSLSVLSLAIHAQDKKYHNIDDSNIALDGYSPVSYLDLRLAQKGSKNFMSEYKSVKYYFTSQEQKALFDKTPEKYLPQYGGWCATGIAVGAKFRTDPNKFLVENGKYYLYLNSIEVDALELWNKSGSKEMTMKANENWKTLKSK
ncbi:MAG: YHS domain-containing (seleno)protein [Cyclobacteriaceae bacterium]